MPTLPASIQYVDILDFPLSRNSFTSTDLYRHSAHHLSLVSDVTRLLLCRVRALSAHSKRLVTITDCGAARAAGEEDDARDDNRACRRPGIVVVKDGIPRPPSRHEVWKYAVGISAGSLNHFRIAARTCLSSALKPPRVAPARVRL